MDPAEQSQRVIDAFFRDGRLVSIPARQGKRRFVLVEIRERCFAEDRDYPEREVNMRLALLHPDVAALRRYLVDAGLMTRSNGIYRRVPGPPEVVREGIAAEEVEPAHKSPVQGWLRVKSAAGHRGRIPARASSALRLSQIRLPASLMVNRARSVASGALVDAGRTRIRAQSDGLRLRRSSLGDLKAP